MDKTGFRLLGIGAFGVLFLVPFVVLFSGNKWLSLLEIPFLLCMALPLWRLTKGYMASFNHGAEVKPMWSRFPRAFLYGLLLIPVAPFYTIVDTIIRRYQVRKLNRNNRNNLLPASYRAKYFFKSFKVLDGENNPFTMTSRGVICSLTVFSWFCVFFFFNFILKITTVNSFYGAGVVGTAVLLSFIWLYISRLRKKIIVKHIKKPRMSKAYFISCSVIMGCFIGSTLYSWHFDVLKSFVGAVAIGGIITSMVYLNGVRGRGFHYEGWHGAPTKFKWKNANYARFGNTFRVRGNFENTYLNRNPFGKED